MRRQAIDTEYGFGSGVFGDIATFQPVIFCAVDVDTGERFHAWGHDRARLRMWLIEHWQDEFVCFNAVAEMGYLLHLSLSLPPHWHDVRLAWRYVSNSPNRPPADLSAALRRNDLEDFVPKSKKELQQKLGTLSFNREDPSELREIVRYCYDDCEACRPLYRRLSKFVPVDWMSYALEFEKATARMERRGIPIDVDTYSRVLEHWPVLLQELADGVNQQAPGVYNGTIFKFNRLVSWCNHRGIQWPIKRSPTTDQWYHPKDDTTFSGMANRHPLIRQIREVEKSKKAFGARKMVTNLDARRHYYSSTIFGAVTGRNTNRQFIFSGPKWNRYLAVPPSDDHVLAYFDFEAEEFGIAAHLSRDAGMVDTYRAKDCHIEFAVRAGAAPEGATKASHPEVRAIYKAGSLGTLYGQSPRGLASQTGMTQERAEAVHADHRALYGDFWAWSERAVETAYQRGCIGTKCGWRMKVPPSTTQTSLMNWHMQAAGGDILRLALIYLDQQNVQTLAPVHDGILVACQRNQLPDLREAVDYAYRTAVEHVLPGFPMRWSEEVFETRFEDKDGRSHWEWLTARLKSQTVTPGLQRA